MWVGGALGDGALAAGLGGIRSWTHSTNEKVNCCHIGLKQFAHGNLVTTLKLFMNRHQARSSRPVLNHLLLPPNHACMHGLRE